MSRPPFKTRVPGPLVVLGVVFAFIGTGCGAVAHMSATEGTASDGKALFQTHCGSCHVLRDAGSAGSLGPNLDETFALVRKQGFDDSTIRDVVRGQVAYPETETASGGPGMPANLLRGEDADNVAQYVTQCAGVNACATG